MRDPRREWEFSDIIGMTGKDWDRDVELYYFNARWYDQETGRFITKDSYEGDQNDPVTLNYYVYTGNNPLIYIDPTGHDFTSPTHDFGDPFSNWMHDTNEGFNRWVFDPNQWWNKAQGYDLNALFEKQANGEYWDEYRKSPYDFYGVKNPYLEYLSFALGNKIDRKNYSFNQYINDMGPTWEAVDKSKTFGDRFTESMNTAGFLLMLLEGGTSPQKVNNKGLLLEGEIATEERILTNISESQVARLSSKFGTYAAKEAEILSGRGISFFGGSAGENFLYNLVGGRSQVPLKVEGLGWRYIDQLSKNIMYESKVGYVKYNQTVIKQIEKDAEIVKRRLEGVEGAHWFFFRSSITGQGGADPRILELLAKYNIPYTCLY